MKILSAEEIKAWDQYSIEHEPIASINLMERAAGKCTEWLIRNGYSGKQFAIFCGKGNNGGDGLAIARMMAEKGSAVSVHILEFGHKGTDDFQINLQRLHDNPSVDIHYVQGEEHFHEFNYGEIIIDALFGSGLNRPLDGVTAKLVEHINQSGCEVISIDIPSGLFVDRSSKENVVIHAKHTLSLQCYKMSFLVAENATAVGNVQILDIGLQQQYYQNIYSQYELIDEELIKSIYRSRNRFTHKGNFGHAALVVGSTGMMGAATLCAQACMRSGVGKLTCYIPKSGYEIMQISVPEAMSRISGFKDYIENAEGLSLFESVAIGPGLGLYESNSGLLRNVFLQCQKPIVIDADALNILSSNLIFLRDIPPYSIITPHKKEFERLFGKSENDFEQIKLAQQKAKELKVIIILKGHHSFIATPGGKGFFNNTGNAGMATGGSGDVLTGLLTGLLAQGYSPVETAILGVCLHGLAGDYAAEKFSQEAMTASDIVESMGDAYKQISAL